MDSYYDFARGIDNRPIIAERERKSVGCEVTFEKDIYTKASVIIELYHITEELIRRLDKDGFKGYTLTLKIKYHDFQQITRSLTSDTLFTDMKSILPSAKELLKQVDFSDEHKIRLIGLSVSNPHDGEVHQGVWVEQELQFKK